MKLLLTLKAHRLTVMRVTQNEIARRARCPQCQISKIEKRGHLPRAWELERYALAYEVTVKDLVRMIENTRQDWNLPLFASITLDAPAVIIPLPTPIAQKAGLA